MRIKGMFLSLAAALLVSIALASAQEDMTGEWYGHGRHISVNQWGGGYRENESGIAYFQFVRVDPPNQLVCVYTYSTMPVLLTSFTFTRVSPAVLHVYD